MSARPFLIALAGAAVLAAVIVVLNVSHDRPDAMAIQKTCGALHWDRYPIVIQVDDSAAEWAAIVQSAIGEWNTAAGREVLRLGTSTPSTWVEYADAFATVGPPPAGRFLVVSGGATGLLASPPTVGTDDGGGVTRMRWDIHTCALGYGAVRLPEIAETKPSVALVVALHELGHVLALGHSGNARSVMWPEVRTPEPGQPWFDPEILPGDLVALGGARPAGEMKE